MIPENWQNMNWRTITDRPLNDRDIENHLNGELFIGQRARASTKYLIIDLDDHNENRNDLHKRYDQIRKVYPETPIVFDTPGNGLHLYYLLDYPVSSHQLKDAVNNDLQKHGLENKPGKFEPYPLTNALIRLPLGYNTYLLNPETLQPTLWDSNEQINSIRWQIENGKIEKLSIGENYRIGENEHASTESEKRKRSKNEFVREVQSLLENGLQEVSTRYESINKLIWNFRIREGYTPEQAEEYVTWWIENKSNGLSKDLKLRPETVKREIKSLSKACKPEKCKNNKGVKFEPLGINDIRKIFFFTKDYKTQQYLFTVLQLAKSNGTVIDKRFDRVPTIEFVMSKTLMETWKNCSRGGYLKHFDFCENINLLQFERDNFSVGRARTYQIQWNFCDGKERYNSLRDYLRTLTIQDLQGIGFSRRTAFRLKECQNFTTIK